MSKYTARPVTLQPTIKLRSSMTRLTEHEIQGRTAPARFFRTWVTLDSKVAAISQMTTFRQQFPNTEFRLNSDDNPGIWQ